MILQYEYWPSLFWVQQMLQSKEWQIEQWGTYQKQSLANRCKITGANGVITLSVPLTGGREQKALLKDVRIDNEQRWAIQHLRTLKSCYGNAPFFDHYFPAVENLLVNPYPLIMQLDHAIITLLLRSLKLDTQIKLTPSFQSPPGLMKKLPELSIKPYVQVFSDRTGFVSDVSFLDALFCLGPQMITYLKR